MDASSMSFLSKSFATVHGLLSGELAMHVNGQKEKLLVVFIPPIEVEISLHFCASMSYGPE